MQNKVLSAHRLKSGNFSSTHFKIAKHGDFADILPFDRFTPNCNAVEDADIILCTLEAFPSASAVNRGVPVILVDPDPRPSLSAELIEAVSCPRLKFVFVSVGLRILQVTIGVLIIIPLCGRLQK